ncbi:MAG: hypothetical protein IMF19_11770 [Proteobacteria bacterium]|nr:hypothetical protein [Pseudomonadota bacterium]
MNKKIAAIVCVFAIVVIIACLGCIDDGGSANNIKAIAEITPKEWSYLNYPRPYILTSYLIYSDIQEMRDDKDFEDIYESIEKRWRLSKLKEYGIDIGDINYIASYISDAGGTVIFGGKFNLIATYESKYMTPRLKGGTIFGGEFDLEDVRDKLNDADFDKDEYKGVEFWLGEHDKAVAISGDKVIMGYKDSVRECIKVMKGSEQSIYDEDVNFRDVIDRLPGGIITSISSSDSGDIRDIRAGGFVLMKEDKDTLKTKGVIKIPDEVYTEAVKSNLKRSLKESLDDIEVVLKGEFLEYTGKMDIADWG